MNRRLVFGVLVISLMGVSRVSAQQPPAVCPTYLYGQWNGVYYYYGEFASMGGCYATGGTSNRMHTLGENCNNINDPLPHLPTSLTLAGTLPAWARSYMKAIPSS